MIPKDYHSGQSENYGHWMNKAINNRTFRPYLVKVIAGTFFTTGTKQVDGFPHSFTELKPVCLFCLNPDRTSAKLAIRYYFQSLIPLNSLLYSLLASLGVHPLPLFAPLSVVYTFGGGWVYPQVGLICFTHN